MEPNNFREFTVWSRVVNNSGKTTRTVFQVLFVLSLISIATIGFLAYKSQESALTLGNQIVIGVASAVLVISLVVLLLDRVYGFWNRIKHVAVGSMKITPFLAGAAPSDVVIRVKEYPYELDEISEISLSYRGRAERFSVLRVVTKNGTSECRVNYDDTKELTDILFAWGLYKGDSGVDETEDTQNGNSTIFASNRKTGIYECQWVKA